MDPIIAFFIAVIFAEFVTLAGAGWLLFLLHKDNVDLRNRLYESKGQPPVGTDYQLRHEERRASQARRREQAPQRSAALSTDEKLAAAEIAVHGEPPMR